MSAQDSRSRFFGASSYSRKIGPSPGQPATAQKPVVLYKPRFVELVEPEEVRVLHTVGPGERLDLIANRYFSNPNGFFLVADPNDCLDAEDLVEPGRTLKIGEGG